MTTALSATKRPGVGTVSGVCALAALALFALPATGLAQNAAQRPCEEGGPYEEFDFWIGDWDVSTPDGKTAGVNSIKAIEGHCVLLENWMGQGGGTGMSINYYDPSTELWNQLWVSPNGAVIRIAGGMKDGSMVLEGELIGPKGKSQPFRGTWTPNDDGSVRQFFEISADDGATWTAWFDGTYVRSGAGRD